VLGDKLTCEPNALVCASGSYRFDKRSLRVREGRYQRGGSVAPVDGGWQWVGEYLGPQAVSGTFRPGALPSQCLRF
jgi:hypothetical protein